MIHSKCTIVIRENCLGSSYIIISQGSGCSKELTRAEGYVGPISGRCHKTNIWFSEVTETFAWCIFLVANAFRFRDCIPSCKFAINLVVIKSLISKLFADSIESYIVALHGSAIVTSTSTPGSMLIDVICFTISEGECKSMILLWIRIYKEKEMLQNKFLFNQSIEWLLRKKELWLHKETQSVQKFRDRDRALWHRRIFYFGQLKKRASKGKSSAICMQDCPQKT